MLNEPVSHVLHIILSKKRKFLENFKQDLKGQKWEQLLRVQQKEIMDIPSTDMPQIGSMEAQVCVTLLQSEWPIQDQVSFPPYVNQSWLEGLLAEDQCWMVY